MGKGVPELITARGHSHAWTWEELIAIVPKADLELRHNAMQQSCTSL